MIETAFYFVVFLILTVFAVWLLFLKNKKSEDNSHMVSIVFLAGFLKRFTFHFVEAISSWRYLGFLDNLFVILGISFSPVNFYALQVLCFLLFLLIASIYYFSVIFLFFYVVISFVLFFLLPILLLQARLKSIKRDFLSSFSFFLDLLALCLSSGRSFNHSLKICSQFGLNPFLLKNIHRFTDQIDSGIPSEQAWKNFAFFCQERDVHTFVLTVLQAQRQGISLVDILHMQSRRIKSVLYSNAEKKALSLSTKMIFPIVIFIFPITFIIISFPLVYNLLSDLG